MFSFNFSLRQDCYIRWSPPQRRSPAAGLQNPMLPGNSRETYDLDRWRGGPEQVMSVTNGDRSSPPSRDARPARDQRRPRRRSIGQGFARRPAPPKSEAFIAPGAPLPAEANGRGTANASISVRRAIEESRCKPSMCPVVKRVHHRFSGQGRRGTLRPLRRSDPVASLPPPAGLCRASLERA